MARRKRTIGQTMIYKILHRKLKVEKDEPHKNRGELGCSRRVNSFCSSSGGEL
jgi:hypothetical protein